MKKRWNLLIATILAVNLATGAIPVTAAEMSEKMSGAESLRRDISTLEQDIKSLEDRQALLAEWIADFETGIENNDWAALAIQTPYSSSQNETLAACKAQLDEARETYDTVAGQHREAQNALEAAKKTNTDAESAREELALILTDADGGNVTAEEKAAANAARMEAVEEEIAVLESTPLVDAYDEKIKVQEAHTEEVEGDWTWTLPENASWADAIYKYGCICKTCNEIFYNDDNIVNTSDASLVGQTIDGKRYVYSGAEGTSLYKWSRHSVAMNLAWNAAGCPEEGTSPLWGHGNYTTGQRIVGYTVYYDDIYKTVHHDDVYDTAAIETFRAEYVRLAAENETIEKDTALIREAEETLAAAQARYDELEVLLQEKDDVLRALYNTYNELELETLKEDARKTIVGYSKEIEANALKLTEMKQELLEKQEELASLEAEIRSEICFSDVADPGKWYYSAVYWAVRNGITNGYGEDTFRPDARLTRAQAVTFLYNMAGHPDVSGDDDAGFTDVKEGKWYESAVKWAIANGITAGYGEGTFQPDTACSRAMIVTFLMRYARLNGTYTIPENLAGFTDVDEDDWFCEAASWAAGNGITSGYGEGTFQPNATCTRAMMVKFLKSAVELQGAG